MRGFRGFRSPGPACFVAALTLAFGLLAPCARAARVSCKIQGIDDKEMVENIEATLSIARARERKDVTAAEIKRLHDRAPGEIREATAPFGYYGATVEGTLTEIGDEDFRAEYTVQLGEPVRVRNVHVAVTGDGSKLKPFPDLAAQFPLKTGDILDQRPYQRRKNTFAAAAADSGYLDATFTTSAILIDREAHIADIDLVFETGTRYRFGNVVFDSSAVDDRVLRSYLTFKRGEPFRYDKLVAFQSGLGGASYFNRVEAVPRRDLAIDYEIPIEVKLTPRRPQHYEVGVGYGTDTGPRLLFGVELRRLNRSGHRFSGRVNVSEIELSLNAEYFVPSRYPDTHAYSFGATIAHLDPVPYTTNRMAFGPTRSQPRFGWLESLTIAYEREDYSVGSDNGVTDLVIGGATYRLKRTDDDIYPLRGYRVDVGARGSHVGLLSTQSFLSLTAATKVVHALNPRVRLLGRVDTGWTSTSTFRDLPPTIRFFAGGDNSVRGYDYLSLGPRDADGRVIGGRLLFTSSAEVEVALRGKFAAAVFYDAGNAFESGGHGVIEQGAGVGLHWRSPVGPIRLDLAYPIEHTGWKLHFTMGPDL
ncbi:MAG TPA: autotransporter assembly complex family protein [Candidatus Krumholzibacteria bacterium]|nr:autotransporter assembly complex family protein [Candidatus Krumholzibacteria bacterium]